MSQRDFRKRAEEKLCAMPFMAQVYEKIGVAVDPAGVQITDCDIYNTPRFRLYGVPIEHKKSAPGCTHGKVMRGIEAELTRNGFNATFQEDIPLFMDWSYSGMGWCRVDVKP